MLEREALRKKLLEVTSVLPPGSRLLIVSKLRTQEEILRYYELGHRDFGENRVQELAEKAQGLREKCPDIRWHMIGHLQSNKVNQLLAVPNLDAIHSVHDQDILDKLIRASDRISHPVDVYLQVNTSFEEEKSGFKTHGELAQAARSLEGEGKFRLKGLMTMGKLRTDDFATEARKCFQLLNMEKGKLEGELGLKLETSMGMSQDYKIALEEKSNWIRLGTVMFT